MVFLGISLVACRGPASSNGAAAPGDARDLEIVVPTDVETLDPRFATDAVSVRTTRLVHGGLVRLDEDDLTPRPYVAERWAWRDERTLEITLRHDVRFHSGQPVRAHDVEATLRAYGSSQVGSRQARVVDAIAGADVVDEHTVVVRLKRPHGTLLTDLELPILRADEAMAPPKPAGDLDGLGPFRVAARDRGAVTLAPADGSPLPRPAHGVVIRTVRDENARALRLLAGRADGAPNGLSPSLLPAFDGREGLQVTARPGANLTYALFRVDRPPFDDVRVRRAFSLSVDRAGLAASVFAGHAVPASTLLPPGHWSHVSGVKAVPFDTAAAAGELGGKRVHATWLTSTDRFRIGVARAVAQAAEAAGFELEIVPLELGTLLTRLTQGDFEMATLQMPELTEPNVLRLFLHSGSIPPAGTNRGHVRDAILDHLLDRGDTEADQEVRRHIYEELETWARRELPIVPLWHEDQVVVASPRLARFRPGADGRWLGLAAVP